ncbi:glycoside hydrolase family 128 protein [Cystobasidium minutum MCA 4210]|uniref:glycoside hydrolase family 128 protein n=1 Tax=Cystobasidium minutum MCA 4210 TaxID=1397322 RepID=UPI0034CD7C23|eukprot:jgi/Rhomi1/194751/gm1.2965_g
MGDPLKMVPLEGKVSWTFNWKSELPALPPGIRYFPQLWNNTADRVARWDADARAAITRGDNVLLSFNEPQLDMCRYKQGCMDVTLAVTEFKKHLTKFKTEGLNVTLVAPSITSNRTGSAQDAVYAGSGIDYLKDFVRLCGTECKFDAVAVNYYGLDVDALALFVKTAHEVSGGKPVWVTEWSYPPQGYDPMANLVQVKKFIKDAVTFMEESPIVAAYCHWWVVSATKEINPGTKVYELNEIGQAYVEA